MSSRGLRGAVNDPARLDQAAEWVLRLREGNSEQAIEGWLQWCEADPRNQRAFDEMSELWRLAEHLPAAAARGALATPPQQVRRGLPLPRGVWMPRLPRPLLFAAAGAMGLALLAAGLLFVQQALHRAGDDDVVATAFKVNEAELSDGSKMELAAKTVAAVHYTPERRSIELKGGEAYFTVAPNKQRPFIVAAGNVRVRAVGTAFNVKQGDGRVVVTVAHGQVDVYQVEPGAGDLAVDNAAARAQANLVRVAAGNQVSWKGPAAADPVVSTVNPAMVLAWREGQLSYDNEPLSSVIADYNRYSQRPALIESEAVKNIRFSGTLRVADARDWLIALPKVFPVEVVQRGDVDVLQPRATQQPAVARPG